MRLPGNQFFNLYYFFTGFFVLVVFYFSAHQAMLIDDGLSGIWEIKTRGLEGYWRSYGFENFYFGHYAVVALLYAVFGLHSLPWFLFFAAMHALNATYIRIFFTKIFSGTQANSRATQMGIFVSLLFLLSPYQSENIVWAATSHYSLSLFVLLILANDLIDKIQGESGMPMLLFHFLFLFSLVTLEISFLFPLLLAFLWLFYHRIGKNRLPWRSYSLKILLPQLLFIGAYLCFHQLVYQSWLPHDRAVHGTPYSVSHAVTTLAQQIVKLFGFVHFLDYRHREEIYTALLHWKKVLLLLAVLSTLSGLLLYKKGKAHFFTGSFLLLSALLLYAPFLRLYFMYLMRIENDRYNYFASVFLFALFVYLLFHIPNYLRYTLVSLYLIAFTVCLFPVISARKHSARLHHAFTEQLDAQSTKGKIYLLNVPASCKDAYVFRSEGRLGIALQTLYGKDLFDRLVQVAWYNAQSENDHFTVSKLSPLGFRVERKTDGVWWMYQSIGASDYENDLYRFTLNEWGDYVLSLKEPLHPGDQLLLYDRGKFIRVNDY